MMTSLQLVTVIQVPSTDSCPWTVTRRGQGYIYMFMCPETMQFKQIGANVDAKHGLVDQGGAFGMEMA